MIGASPSDSSSASSTFGSRPRARASDSICCSPPEHSPARAVHDRLERREVAERDRRRHGGQLQVVGHRHVHDHRALLGDVAEAVPAAHVHRRRGRLAEEPDLAVHRRQLAGQGEQRGGLAGAVGAEERHDLAGVDAEVDVADDGHLPVAGRQPLRLDQGVGHARHLLDRVGVAEVGVAHRRVVADLRGRAAGDHRRRSRSRRCGRRSTSRGRRRARRAARPCCARRRAAG